MFSFGNWAPYGTGMNTSGEQFLWHTFYHVVHPKMGLFIFYLLHPRKGMASEMVVLKFLINLNICLKNLLFGIYGLFVYPKPEIFQSNI